MDPQYIALHNFRISNQNDATKADFDIIQRRFDDINTNAVAIKNAQMELKKINNRLDFPNGVSIASIKSMDVNHGSILSLYPLAELDSYQVNINDQCLSVYGSDKVMLKPCQLGGSVSDSQRFITTRIKTPLGAKAEMNTPYISPAMVYPYNIFRSAISGQCMALNDNGDVVMQTCSPNNIRQHWKISPNENICPQ